MASTPKTGKSEKVFTPPSALSMSSEFHGRSLSGSLKNEIEEKQKLEKENFDLKMKIYYLEDNLRQVGGSGVSNEVDELRTENTNLRLKVEEQNIDLEQRNALLMKAKGAIESLKSELDKMKVQFNEKAARESELVGQVRSLAEAENTSDSEYRQEIASLHSTISTKNDELYHMHADLTQCRSELADSRQAVLRMESEQRETADRLRAQTNRATTIDEDIVKARTENDMLRIQLEEYGTAIDGFRVRAEEAMRAKEESERNTASLSTKYESQLENMRMAHAQEIESLRLVHASAMSDARESFRREMESLNSEHADELREIRNHELGGTVKVKEELTERLHEKSEEVVALKGIVQLERSRVDSLTQELHSVRNECEKWNKEAMSWKSRSNECSIRLEDVSHSLDAAQQTVHAQKEELMILKHDSQNGKYSLDSLHKEIQQKVENISALEKELSALQGDNLMLRSLTEGVEGTSRDNERLKALLANSQNELSVLQLKHDHLNSSNISLQSDLAKRDARVHEMGEEAHERAEKIDRFVEELDKCKESLRDEKSRSVALEAALKEHRAMSIALQSELDNIREQKMHEERRHSEEGNRLIHARSDFGKTCSVVLQALLKWDKVLVLAMESFDIHDNDRVTEIGDHRYLSRGSNGSKSSSMAMPLWWNESSRQPGNDTMMLVEGMLDRPDELLQSSVAIVERIQVKLERLMKIRRLFESKSTHMVAEMESKLKYVQDTAELLSHKIGTMHHLVRNTEDIVLKEKKTRDESNHSMRTFQESIVTGHTKQIRDLEEKCTEGALALQNSQHQVRSLEHEVHVLREEVSILTEEKDRLTDAEEVIEKLKAKFDEVAKSNQLMSYEIDDRGSQLDDLNKKIRELNGDNERLNAAATALKDQIELRDKVLNEQETLLSGLKAEINHLKQHQIDPKLEKSIIESQDVLRASLEKRYENSEHYSVNDRTLTVFHKMISNLSSLQDSAVNLVRDTQDMLREYEDRHRVSALDMGTNYGLRSSTGRGSSGSIDQNVLDLLNANAKLSLQLQHALTDIKKLSTAPPFSSSFGHHALSGGNVLKPDSRDRKEGDSTTSLNHSRLNGSRGLSLDMLSTSRGASRDNTHPSAYDRGDTNYTLSRASYTSNRDDDDSRLHHGRVLSDDTSQDHVYCEFGRVPPREDPISVPAASQRYHPSTSSFSHSRGSMQFAVHPTNTASERERYTRQQTSDLRPASASGYRLSNGAVQLSHRQTPSPSSKSRFEPRTSSGGVNTVARESAGRLSRLGSDLQSLAAKLDSFDVRHSTR